MKKFNIDKLLVFLSQILMILFSLQCVTYRNFPEEKVNKPPKEEIYDNLFFRIYGRTIFGGLQGLKDAFKKSPFRKKNQVDDIPDKGIYVEVKIDTVDPSKEAIVFGYVSTGCLTLLPFWTREDGYDIRYSIYIDKSLQKSYNYEIRRKAFVWLLMLPVAWINTMTYSENEAFEATTYLFFDQAKSVFEKSRIN